MESGKYSFSRYKILQINVRENRRGNQEWTNQRQWKHMTHKTQHENKQNRTQKTKKDEQYGPHKNWK